MALNNCEIVVILILGVCAGTATTYGGNGSECNNCMVPNVVCFYDRECPGEDLCQRRGLCKDKPICIKEEHICKCQDGLSWDGLHCDCKYPHHWDNYYCHVNGTAKSKGNWVEHMGEFIGLVFLGVLCYLFYKLVYLPRKRRRDRGRDRICVGVQPVGNPGLMKSYVGNPPPPPQPGAVGYMASQPGASGYIAPQPGAPGYMAPQPGALGYMAPQPGAPGYMAPQPGAPGYMAPQPGAPGYMAPQQQGGVPHGAPSPYPPPYEANPTTLIQGVAPPPYTPPNYANIPPPGRENFQTYYYYQPPGQPECKYQAAYPPL